MKSQVGKALRHHELFRSPSTGYRSLRKARARILALKAHGVSDIDLKAMLARSGLDAVDFEAFCAADTREKLIECVASVPRKGNATGAQAGPGAGSEPLTQTPQ